MLSEMICAKLVNRIHNLFWRSELKIRRLYNIYDFYEERDERDKKKKKKKKGRKAHVKPKKIIPLL